MHHLCVFLLLLGSVWAGKGVLYLMQGEGATVWADDLLFGGVILVAAVILLVRLRGSARSAQTGE